MWYTHVSHVQSELPYTPVLANWLPYSGSAPFVIMYCALPVVTPLKYTAGAVLKTVATGYEYAGAVEFTTKSPLANDTAPGVTRLSQFPATALKSTACMSTSSPAVAIRGEPVAVAVGVVESEMLAVGVAVNDGVTPKLGVADSVDDSVGVSDAVVDGDDVWVGVDVGVVVGWYVTKSTCAWVMVRCGTECV